MRGKTLCVDLSTWICQAEEVAPLKSAVAKPYLRNTIFRVLCLRRLGTKLIFVTEGTPPQLKYDVILARKAKACEQQENAAHWSSRPAHTWKNARKGGQKSVAGSQTVKEQPVASGCARKKIGRSVFQRKINECAQLLRLLGIPVVKSEGEAEACCALLNKEKVADGCITEDGDTFLYGGKIVYKNLGISAKDPHVFSYSMERIESEIGITRNDMVALALLLGCDYTDGVPGIGKQTAMKLLHESNGDILERLKSWSQSGCTDMTSSIEKQAFRKIAKVEGFPNEEVINEFLIPKDKLDKIIPQIKWTYPDLVNLQRFCLKHMEWPEEYTASKVLGVATNEYLYRIPRGMPLECPLSAVRLVKTRIQHGVPLCEVEWSRNPTVNSDLIWRGYPETFITLESQQSILDSLPLLVEEFEKTKKSKSSKKKADKTKAKEVECSSLSATASVDEIQTKSRPRNASPLQEICTNENAGKMNRSEVKSPTELSELLANLRIDAFGMRSTCQSQPVVVEDEHDQKKKENEEFEVGGCNEKGLHFVSLKERLLSKTAMNRLLVGNKDSPSSLKGVEAPDENIESNIFSPNEVKSNADLGKDVLAVEGESKDEEENATEQNKEEEKGRRSDGEVNREPTSPTEANEPALSEDIENLALNSLHSITLDSDQLFESPIRVSDDCSTLNTADCDDGQSYIDTLRRKLNIVTCDVSNKFSSSSSMVESPHTNEQTHDDDVSRASYDDKKRKTRVIEEISFFTNNIDD
eukprot:gene7415-8235_t